MVGEHRSAARLERLAQRLRDRVARAVADLEQPLAARSAATGEPIAAAARWPRPFEPLDISRVNSTPSSSSQWIADGASLVRTSTRPRVRGVVRAPHDVLRMDLGRVVLAERGLDAALRLRGVAGLQRRLRREADTGAGAFRGDGGRETGCAAADHEHVEGGRFGHPRILHHLVISVITQSLSLSGNGARQRARSADRLARYGNARRHRQAGLPHRRARGHARRGRGEDDRGRTSARSWSRTSAG